MLVNPNMSIKQMDNHTCFTKYCTYLWTHNKYNDFLLGWPGWPGLPGWPGVAGWRLAVGGEGALACFTIWTIRELSGNCSGTLLHSTWWASLPALAWHGLAGWPGWPGLAGLPAWSWLAWPQWFVCKHAHSVCCFWMQNQVVITIVDDLLYRFWKHAYSVFVFVCKTNGLQQLLIIFYRFQKVPTPFAFFACKTNWF